MTKQKRRQCENTQQTIYNQQQDEWDNNEGREKIGKEQWREEWDSEHYTNRDKVTATPRSRLLTYLSIYANNYPPNWSFRGHLEHDRHCQRSQKGKSWNSPKNLESANIILMNATWWSAMQQTRMELERKPFKNKRVKKERKEWAMLSTINNDNNTIFEFSTQGSNQSNLFFPQSCFVMQAVWSEPLTFGWNRRQGDQFTTWSKGWLWQANLKKSEFCKGHSCSKNIKACLKAFVALCRNIPESDDKQTTKRHLMNF